MRVKICGITNPDDALAAARYGADFVGLILAPSARRVTVRVATQLVDVLPPETQPVLVFRDAPMDELLAALNDTGCEWVQLHGREPPPYLKELETRCPQARVIKGWEVSGPSAGDELISYLRQVGNEGARIEVVILDVPKDGPHPGYQCLAEVSRRCVGQVGTSHRQAAPGEQPRIWCAGGLTPENLATVVAAGCYDGVDVAGGVESRPGVKDHDAMRRFIEAAKSL